MKDGLNSCPYCGKTIIQTKGKITVGCEHYPASENNDSLEFLKEIIFKNK